MEVDFTNQALQDIAYWKKTKNIEIQNKISSILDSIQENPFKGIGKPEALKYNYAGYWSRRINHEHRFIYKIVENRIVVHSLKGHYL